MKKWNDVIGKTIIGFLAYPKEDEASFILFDDGQTYLQLVEQDPYEYHDCAHSARTIEILHDKVAWEGIFNDPNYRGTSK